MRSQQLDDAWAPIPRASLSGDVAERVIAHVLDGTFALGERLPSERDLAMRLQVARPTLREALSALSVIGVIEVHPGAGTFIVSRHADFVARAFSWAMLLDGGAAQDIVDARVAVECELARLSAQRAERAELARIVAIVEQMRSAAGRRAFADLDLEFHHRIAFSARSRPLLRSLEAIRSLVTTWINIMVKDPATRSVAVEQHARIASALQARDPDDAAAAMRVHIERMGALLVASANHADVSDWSEVL